MRIGFIASGEMPSRWAEGVQLARMAEAFSARGHQVTLYARRGDAPAETSFVRYGVARSFDIVTLGDRGWPLHQLVFNRLAMLADLRRRPRFDLFYARYVNWLDYVAASGVPMVFEAHGVRAPGTRGWHRLERLFARPDFRRLVCVTGWLAEAYRARHPALGDHEILVAPSAASPLPEATPLAHWPGRAGALQVGFTGTPFPGKGIEAMVAAATRMPEADFHIVGAGAADIGWIAPPYPANLHFHGYQPYRLLGAYLARFDVAAAPYARAVFNRTGRDSAAVTSPSKLAEYFAAGLPVIAGDLPGVRDMTGEGETALLIPPGDADAFVAALGRLSDAPGLRAALSAAARARFEQALTASARAERVLAGLYPSNAE